jgi:hypothetical protein
VALVVARRKGGIHVHVVGGQVQCDETLEDDYPSRESGRQEDSVRSTISMPLPMPVFLSRESTV